MRLRTRRIEAWVTVEREGNKAEFFVHPLSPKEAAAILDKCKETVWEKGQRFQEPNYYKFKLLKINATILKWKGVEDEEGAELRCIDANKEIAYLGNPELIDEVLEKADALYKDVQDSLEKEAKNSVTVQTGDQIQA